MVFPLYNLFSCNFVIHCWLFKHEWKFSYFKQEMIDFKCQISYVCVNSTIQMKHSNENVIEAVSQNVQTKDKPGLYLSSACSEK